MNGYSVRFIKPDDLLEVGHLHCGAFPNDLRSQLGAKVVARSFARKLSRQAEVRGSGAYSPSGDLLGFCFGGANGETAKGLDLKDVPLLASRIVLRPRLLLRLNLFKRIKERWLAHPKKAKSVNSSSSPQTGVRYYNILSLAVRSSARRLGIGERLMALHEAFAIQERCMAISLLCPTDDPNTLAFYEHIGFHKKLDEGEIWRGQMLKTLKQPSPDLSARSNDLRRPLLTRKPLNPKIVPNPRSDTESDRK